MIHKFYYYAITILIIILFLDAKAETYPTIIRLPSNKTEHIQGIAYDYKNKYMYVSYTTMLLKIDNQGNIIGSINGIIGHLGCISFNEDNGKVYGSLEYKDDKIGKGIAKREKISIAKKTSFCIAIFEVDKVTKMNMNAEDNNIMKTVYLPTVLKDYNSYINLQGKKLKHRFGCSGIDGVCFGPSLKNNNHKTYLTVAYGIYSDINRDDNNYQVLLQYDISNWKRYERVLNQDNMHNNGPSKPYFRCFVKTGNTTYGVQNLTYDNNSKIWYMACYPGIKKQYPNYTIFAIDQKEPAVNKKINDIPYIKSGYVKPLLFGCHFPYGTTGMSYLESNLFYFTINNHSNNGYGGVIKLLKRNDNNKNLFIPIE